MALLFWIPIGIVAALLLIQLVKYVERELYRHRGESHLSSPATPPGHAGPHPAVR